MSADDELVDQRVIGRGYVDGVYWTLTSPANIEELLQNLAERELGPFVDIMQSETREVVVTYLKSDRYVVPIEMPPRKG